RARSWSAVPATAPALPATFTVTVTVATGASFTTLPRSAVGALPAGRALTGGRLRSRRGRYLLALRAYLVQVDLATGVDVGDLHLYLVADVEVVLNLLHPFPVAHLRDVQQAVTAGQQ